jgi:hypothetical protein
MQFEDAEKSLNSIMDLYVNEIKREAMRQGGYTALSLKLGKESSYIASTIARGKLNSIRKVMVKIKEMEGVK